MDNKQKQIFLIENLLSHTITLRKKIEVSNKHIPYMKSYLKILINIEETLSNQPLDLDRLRRDKFGIFRIVDGFADNPIEKEMMELHDEIFDLLKLSKDL